MAKQLPAQLSHKSALVLLPPSHITAPIEAVRRVYDKQFLRWPPHINLLYPFLISPSESGKLKDDIRIRIGQVARTIPPFHMSLDSNQPGVFHHTLKNKTVWLGPTTYSNIRKLQAALHSEFSVNEVDRDRRPFMPHLSVGKTKSQGGVDTISVEIAKSISRFRTHNVEKDNKSTALEWYVDRVHVLERKDEKDPFKIIGTISLGETSTRAEQATTSVG
ncbi:hypothetical protein COCC4DRAFT_203586 [Bipolaris maydis ATCC 48331]|uniref:Phosphoesterase HXTX domain-containing protein n=2 Tax=Cochliobolus heterostrophus TaxID=5016 RepID=M2V440_COCH5|nr:uncharacterized protein COCC4DRAFT_203586 [Bipolaris maydis ATCC 48331]EMD94773.1 hypothetical protein COCHEDRAFT_1222072 [Bipolaris maydis C5]KAH7556028.1 hypothetical protein BM1_06554 [Bipolaris maydis]ENI01515.1 hypothetical protein COCC4DRAFT_203586 [Bipolaris maydis ATCC 48331]KAJ5029191.1 2'-5' RNA ligase superfamily-domain-containing protein [Bipolaris maydis]KAJ5062075.1 2'-5' RNA ligase superfamily-domain-containing protein [Bipolaris maydis]